jgi:integrase
MSTRDWHKLRVRGAPDWLECQKQRHRDAYRVNYRRLGVKLRKVIEGEFDDWRAAVRPGEKLIEEAKKAAERKRNPELNRAFIKCSDLVDEILKDKAAANRRRATIEQAEIFYRVHILPFLARTCPYAVELSGDTWNAYKRDFRERHPESPLFNHWKFFITLFKKAKSKGLIEQWHKLEYSEKDDDNRARGLVIPDEEMKRILAEAPHVSTKWYLRILLQRATGRRPGEIRALRKTRAGARESNLTWMPDGNLLVRLFEADTKTKAYSEFKITEPFLLRSVREAWERYPDSPYLFPNGRDRSKPMDKHLSGWYSILENARVSKDYTPHDIRHTYLTEIFKTRNDWAIICFQAGLSLEEARETYIHITAEDTVSLASSSGAKVADLAKGVA